MRIPDRTLLQWLDDPAPDRGLHFAQPDGTWDFWPYTRLWNLSLRVVSACAERGLRNGDVVAIVQRCGPGFVAGMFGALAAGATVTSIAPPFAFQRGDDYERHLSHVLGIARPALIVVGDDGDLARVAPIADAAGLAAPVRFDDLVAGRAPEWPTGRAETALLQFTSGSSGFSRGVRISPDALAANVNAIRRHLLLTPDGPIINWMPVHHDMGLIGGLITSVVTGCDGWLMQPEDFIRTPLRYLSCISDQRIRFAPMPNFGLAYILRRIRPEQLAGLRFDSLRAVILGAERIDPRVLVEFERLLGPNGLDRRALTPAYGSAEATLAVTMLPLEETWSTAAPDGASTPLVGCGRPIGGTPVRVVNARGGPAPDGEVGQIVVGGESLATGYVGDSGTASGTSIQDGLLYTGDAGFVRDGQLFVLGRLGDGLKVRGRMVFAESLEARFCELGIPERRAAALLGIRDGRPTAAVVLAAPRPEWPAIARRVLAEQIEGADLVAVTVPRAGLAVTSSGKPRRRVMWQAFCDGTLEGDIRPLAPEPAPAGTP
ncbi:AMP-binding protein [Actinomadura macra]|uniref:AMP-binding protein n=1 Tax=Actinomadura macra TaxID=46164 RepID=UPI000832114F|nr:AMP-binding protein [Actinomadura macra]